MSGTLLVLGAGAYYARVIRQLRDAGIRTVAVDRDPAAPGLALADAGHAVDLSDADAVLALIEREPVDGVLPLNDFGVPTAARVAGHLGAPGLTAETAAIANDKGLMRERWDEHGLPNAAFRVATDRAGAERAAAELGMPLVLKPADSGGGGRGVSVVRDPSELAWAWEFAAPFARNGRVVVERFLEGLELTVEAVAHRGEVHVLAMSDKVKAPLRTRVATRLHYPAALEPGVREAAEDVARRAVLAVGLTDGPAHVELIVTEAGPTLVELGARGGGGHIFSTIVEAVSGVNMVRESARVLLGQTPDLAVRHQRGCVYHLFTPAGGVLREVRGVDEARAMPGVLDLGITRRAGAVLGELSDSLQRSGFAVVAGNDRGEAILRADAVARTVVFDLDPLPQPV